jgi:IS30 family transposase
MKAMFPRRPELQVSHETVYNAIYAQPHGELRKELITCLRQGHTKRRPRAGGVDRRQQIPDLVNIHLRPPEVDERLLPGHWEGDLIKGAFNRSAVGTLVERVSGSGVPGQDERWHRHSGRSGLQCCVKSGTAEDAPDLHLRPRPRAGAPC